MPEATPCQRCTPSAPVLLTVTAVFGLAIGCFEVQVPFKPFVVHYTQPAIATRPLARAVQPPVLPNLRPMAAYRESAPHIVDVVGMVASPGQNIGGLRQVAATYVQQASPLWPLLVSLVAAALASVGLHTWRSAGAKPQTEWAMAAGFGAASSKGGKKAKGKKSKTAPPKSEADKPCGCGSGQTYGGCCEPYLVGPTYPETAEALARVRYTALIKNNAEFIYQTTEEGKLTDEDKKAIQNTIDGKFFEELKILKEEAGEGDGEAYVTSRVWYRFKTGNLAKELFTTTERSLFRNVEGRWVVVEAVESNNQSFRPGDVSDTNTDPVLKARDVAMEKKAWELAMSINAKMPTNRSQAR
uniref:YchJ-like middle NTF2-like domain-containing protein n=1 Tax=Eutreptiella gymnastica TaxID=73025 RepID=A0A7S1HW30_9EUGL